MHSSKCRVAVKAKIFVYALTMIGPAGVSITNSVWAPDFSSEESVNRENESDLGEQ